MLNSLGYVNNASPNWLNVFIKSACVFVLNRALHFTNMSHISIPPFLKWLLSNVFCFVWLRTRSSPHRSVSHIGTFSSATAASSTAAHSSECHQQQLLEATVASSLDQQQSSDSSTKAVACPHQQSVGSSSSYSEAVAHQRPRSLEADNAIRPEPATNIEKGTYIIPLTNLISAPLNVSTIRGFCSDQ